MAGAVDIRVGDGSEADVRTWLDVHNAVRPYDRVSLADARHIDEQTAWSLDLIASVDGEAVGVGYTAPRLLAGEAEDAMLIIAVLPSHRRRGIGTALWRGLSDRARAEGKRAFKAFASERDPDGLAVAARWGFERIGADVELALDLSSAPAPPVDAPPGIAVTTLAERPDLERGVYAVACEAIPDIPGDEDRSAGDFETFRRRDLDSPTKRRDAWFVATAGDDVVGYAALTFSDEEPGTASHFMTAVARAWRGRGIAGTLKRASIAWAREAGLRELRTSTELRNAPMRRVNEQLGYRPLPASVTLRGPLAPPA